MLGLMIKDFALLKVQLRSLVIIFAIAMKTLKVKGISNKYMKYSHLIGGIIMFIIGLLLLLRPQWLMFNF